MVFTLRLNSCPICVRLLPEDEPLQHLILAVGKQQLRLRGLVPRYGLRQIFSHAGLIYLPPPSMRLIATISCSDSVSFVR